MKEKLYIETSIVSYLTSKPSRDIITAAHQQITNYWWENHRNEYNVFTSQIVIDEANAGDPKAAQKRLEKLQDIDLLEITDEIIRLAENLMDIANAKMRPLIEKVIYDNGFLAPIICTPEELIGE